MHYLKNNQHIQNKTRLQNKVEFGQLWISSFEKLLHFITPPTTPAFFFFFSGNAGILKLFEGESDHLIPSDSEELIENNLFTMAGRMIGHSFLHSGPSFPGLSPAIIHVLFLGSLEETHLTVEDCPDLDIRGMIRLVRRWKNPSA